MNNKPENIYVLEKALINAQRKPKPLEFALKQLKHAEEKREHHIMLLEQSCDDFHWWIIKQLDIKIKEIKKRIELMENAPTPTFVKEIEIARLSKMHGFDDYMIEWREEAEKTIAIIDEIFESEFCMRSKIRLIKLYLNGKITTNELDALLTE